MRDVDISASPYFSYYRLLVNLWNLNLYRFRDAAVLYLHEIYTGSDTGEGEIETFHTLQFVNHSASAVDHIRIYHGTALGGSNVNSAREWSNPEMGR